MKNGDGDSLNPMSALFVILVSDATELLYSVSC
jgi:hypothetical protein